MTRLNTVKRTFLSLLSCAALAVATAPTSATMIDFEDGTGHDNVIPASHYTGLTFTNAVWIDVSSAFHNGNYGLGVDAGVQSPNDWAFPGTTSPIEIAFDVPMSEVSILAKEVSGNGAQIEAFDEFDVSVDVDNVVFGGTGDATLTVFGTDIRRIELTQHLSPAGGGDGVGWDDLNFTEYVPPVPEPSTAFLCLGALVLARLRRRRVR